MLSSLPTHKTSTRFGGPFSLECEYWESYRYASCAVPSFYSRKVWPQGLARESRCYPLYWKSRFRSTSRRTWGGTVLCGRYDNPFRLCPGSQTWVPEQWPSEVQKCLCIGVWCRDEVYLSPPLLIWMWGGIFSVRSVAEGCYRIIGECWPNGNHGKMKNSNEVQKEVRAYKGRVSINSTIVLDGGERNPVFKKCVYYKVRVNWWSITKQGWEVVDENVIWLKQQEQDDYWLWSAWSFISGSVS